MDGCYLYENNDFYFENFENDMNHGDGRFTESLYDRRVK